MHEVVCGNHNRLLFVSVIFSVCLLIELGLPSFTLAKNEELSVSKDIKEETLEAVESAKGYVARQKEEFEKKIQKDLAELDIKFQELKTKAGHLQAKAKIKLNDELEKLKAEKEALKPKIENMQRASETAWEDLRQGVQRAVEELRNAIDRATSSL